jgi:ribose transport system permease protein
MDAIVTQVSRSGRAGLNLVRLAQDYAVLVAIAVLFVTLTVLSPSFLTVTNLLNILNQNAPLIIIAAAMTMVIISGGFDLSVGAIFAVAGVVGSGLALAVDPALGLVAAPLTGLVLGMANGVVITALRVHSFLATLATSMVFRGVAMLVSGGLMIPVRLPEFTWLGRDRIGGVFVAVWVMLAVVVVLTVLLNRTPLGRKIIATGGNSEAAVLAGVNVDRVRIAAFALAGTAAGIAAAISVSRLSMGQANVGVGLELQAIAAVILGGTSIYGGQGAVWRSVAGVLLLALINNGFNILNADPFLKDLTTGVVILAAVGLSSVGRRH